MKMKGEESIQLSLRRKPASARRKLKKNSAKTLWRHQAAAGKALA